MSRPSAREVMDRIAEHEGWSIETDPQTPFERDRAIATTTYRRDGRTVRVHRYLGRLMSGYTPDHEIHARTTDKTKKVMYALRKPR